MGTVLALRTKNPTFPSRLPMLLKKGIVNGDTVIVQSTDRYIFYGPHRGITKGRKDENLILPDSPSVQDVVWHEMKTTTLKGTYTEAGLRMLLEQKSVENYDILMITPTMKREGRSQIAEVFSTYRGFVAVREEFQTTAVDMLKSVHLDLSKLGNSRSKMRQTDRTHLRLNVEVLGPMNSQFSDLLPRFRELAAKQAEESEDGGCSVPPAAMREQVNNKVKSGELLASTDPMREGEISSVQTTALSKIIPPRNYPRTRTTGSPPSSLPPSNLPPSNLPPPSLPPASPPPSCPTPCGPSDERKTLLPCGTDRTFLYQATVSLSLSEEVMRKLSQDIADVQEQMRKEAETIKEMSKIDELDEYTRKVINKKK
ncbi:hypothetical protein T439DRAFT_328476 [Meredithblackwellia eburnea MCA 4105]